MKRILEKVRFAAYAAAEILLAVFLLLLEAAEGYESDTRNRPGY